MMRIFSEQGKRTLKWGLIGGCLIALALMALRTAIFVIFNFGISHQIAGEVPSPSGNTILTVYDSYGIFGFQGGTTVFNLRLKGERIKFLRNGYWSGRRLIRPSDVAIVGGDFYPYDIAWLGEHNLSIKSAHLPGYRYKWAKYDSHDSPMFEKHDDQWRNVVISYELIKQHPGNNETRIIRPGDASQKKRRPTGDGSGHGDE